MSTKKTLNFIFFIISFELSLGENSTNGLRKGLVLSIPVFIPFRGYEPAAGKTCAASVKIVEKLVNQRSDILPRYAINTAMLDENLYGVGAIRYFLGYMAKFQPGNRPATNIFPSPLAVGPFSCQFVSPIMKPFHMSLFSEYCNGEHIVSLPFYDNVFRIRAPANLYIGPMLAMAVKIAKWKQIAIVTTTNLPAEMLFIKRLYKEAISSGLEIVHFDAVPTFNRDVVLELKQSDARVVYFSSVNYRSCQELLCLMHREGITAPTYVFITTFFCLPAKSDDPPFD